MNDLKLARVTGWFGLACVPFTWAEFLSVYNGGAFSGHLHAIGTQSRFTKPITPPSLCRYFPVRLRSNLRELAASEAYRPNGASASFPRWLYVAIIRAWKLAYAN